MRVRSRGAFLRVPAVTAAAVAGLRFPAGAAEFSYKLSHDRPAGDPVDVQINAAAAKVQTDTGGRLEIKVFPNNTLGGNTKILPQVREGAVEFTLIGDVIASSIVPSASLDGVGFAFPDYKAAWAALDGPLGGYIRSQIEQQMGVYAFETVWDGGFKQISNSVRPIEGPEDLKGLKIRVPTGAIAVSLYRTFGASPVALDQNEQYASAQSHLLDGMDTSVDLLLNNRLFEVQKYLSITNHSIIIWHVLAAGGPWQRLPKNLRDVTERAFSNASKALRAGAPRDFQAAVAALKARGIAVVQPEPAPFRAALRQGGYYAQWRDKFGPQAWSMLEKAAGTLS